jgi:hypothetical protein
MVVAPPRPFAELRPAARLDRHGTPQGQHRTVYGSTPIPSGASSMLIPPGTNNTRIPPDTGKT